MANAYTLVGGLGGGNDYTGSYTIVPTNSPITIPNGTVFSANLVVKGDANLIPSNIMQGYTIFGVRGDVEPVIYEGGYGVAYIGTSTSDYKKYRMTNIAYK